ncbi:MAG: DNA polymerase III subunit delta [Burkholderiaceae bacterium]|nr:DNA polymerase III subunit delta [Burkholderiaceae bacterium]MEB2352729.1 DNA polymerase III subunit delta [Burkholderiaceae bacterium]
MTQVRAEGLVTALARGVPPLVWIHGDEPLLLQEAADAVRRALRDAGFDERRVFDGGRGFRADAFVAEAGALSLFASRRLLELRLAGKANREIGQALADAAAHAGADTRLLVTGPRLDRAITETAWFAALDRLGLIVPVWPVERAQLPQWIAARLARQNQRADRDTLALIAERVEGNLLAAHQEIGKLGLLFPEGALPPAQTRAAVLDVARYDASDLVAAMLAGDVPRALRTLDGLRAEGVPEPLVLWMLADALRTLLRLVEARSTGRPLAQAMREARVFGAREHLFEQALRRLGEDRIREALQCAARTDRMIKGLDGADAWRGLQELAMSVAGAPILAGN